jgi:hypothetical protein
MVATPFDEASDNIRQKSWMLKILCLYSILPVPLENLRGAYYSRIYGVHSLYF